MKKLRRRDFSVDRFDAILTKALACGASIYSAAYIMPSGPESIRRARKHQMHLELLASLLSSDFPERLMDTGGMAELYELFCSVPSIGPFLAYQFATDLNYSEDVNFSEMEFVVPGPGARDGIRKCFTGLGGYSEADVIRWVAGNSRARIPEARPAISPAMGTSSAIDRLSEFVLRGR